VYGLAVEQAVSPDVASAKPPKKSRKKQLITIGVAIVVIGLTFAFVLPKIADYRSVWDVIRTLSWLSILALVGATVLNVVTFAPPWMVCMPKLGFVRALLVTQASTATTYVAPGGAAPGMAVSFAMLRAWGFTSRQVAVTVAVLGVWNQMIIFGSVPFAFALLALVGESDPLLRSFAVAGLVVFAAGIALFAAIMWSENLARWVGDTAAQVSNWAIRIMHRGPVKFGGHSVVGFRNDALDLLRRRWHVITLATLAGQLSMFLLLYVTVRVLGIGSSELLGVEIFAAWTVAKLIGSIPITPGGLGVVELGLTSLLVAFGAPKADAVAATLVYRTLSIVPTLVLGLIAAATWKRYQPGAKPVVDAGLD
jgi:putative heme transporter